MTSTVFTTGQRSPSLDAARGLGVLLMIAAVWLPGAVYHLQPGSALGRHLLGSVWHGFHLADLLMTVFLFCAGMAAAIQVTQANIGSTTQMFRRALMRSFLLFVLGLITVNWIPMIAGRMEFRLTGPLQQIAVALLVTQVVLLSLPRGSAPIAAIYGLANYGFLLATFRPDSQSAAVADPLAAYGFQSNLAVWVDSGFLPGSRSFGNWDQFGIVPTAVGVLVSLCGAGFQQLVLATDLPRPVIRQGASVLAGAVMATVAWTCSSVIPINHYLWTVTFVGLSVGVLMVCLSCLQLWFEKPRRADLFLLRAMGRNSLLFFVICCLAAEMPLTLWNMGLVKSMPADWQAAGLVVIVAAELLLLTGLGSWLAIRAQFFTVNRLLGEGRFG